MEHNVEIELVHSTKKWLFFKSNNFVLQDRPFALWLKIKNVSEKEISQFTIGNIQIKSSDNQDIITTIDNPPSIEHLGPNEQTTIPLGVTGTPMWGLAHIVVRLLPPEGATIQALQKNRYSDDRKWVKLESGQGLNRWIDFFVITSKSERTQNIFNIVLAISSLFALGAVIIQTILQISLKH